MVKNVQRSLIWAWVQALAKKYIFKNNNFNYDHDTSQIFKRWSMNGMFLS